MKHADHIADAIKHVGSQAKLAAKINRSQAWVSKLVRGEGQSSAEDAILIETATDGRVPRHVLRPDLWNSGAK